MYLFVAGLPYDLDDAELMEIFEKFGTIKSAKVAMDKETGKSRGFGFVEMANRDILHHLTQSFGTKIINPSWPISAIQRSTRLYIG